jgi:CheY-specific phosphatase CheX
MLKPIKMERMREGLRKLVDTLPNRNGPWRVPHGECVAVALEETLRKLCHLDLQQSEHLETGQPSGAVFSMIYIFGGVDWFLQLRFDEVAAVVTASRLAGTKLAFDDPDLLDALAEVTSTVAGALKRLLIERGISVNVALPTVVGATGLRFHQPQGQMRSVDTLCYAGLGLDTASSAGSAHPGQICVAVTVGSPPGLML